MKKEQCIKCPWFVDENNGICGVKGQNINRCNKSKKCEIS